MPDELLPDAGTAVTLRTTDDKAYPTTPETIARAQAVTNRETTRYEEMAESARADVPNEATWPILESIATDALEVTERYQADELDDVVVGSATRTSR